MSFEERIDVHAHFLPAFYRKVCLDNGLTKVDGMNLPHWSEESHLTLMGKLNITKSIISISSPGVYVKHNDPAAAKKLSRDCNEYAAEISSRRPGQFGFWASLPLPDVPCSLEELDYAFDKLHADGVSLLTHFHGVYLGDKKFDPIFEELNRRKAKVFIHPTTPCMADCHSHGPTPATPLPHYPPPAFEFMFDTARAVINLFVSGTLARNPDITFVIPHAGGALPPIIERFTAFGALLPLAQNLKLTSDGVKATLRKQFYFDLAGMPFPDQIYGLLRYVDPSRLLYGSDCPFTPDVAVLGLAERMRGDSEKIWTREQIKGILKVNAVEMFGESKL